MRTRPFDFRDELGYAAGDMAGSFVNLYIEGYFLTFCTYALGIAPQWMAGLFLVSRLLDACLGPYLGSLPDRRRLGRSGDKFQPWVRLFSVPLALSGVLCFLAVPFGGSAARLWAAGCYLLYSISYSGASIPYGAMINTVTQDAAQRSKLSRARSIGGTLVAFGALSLIPTVCFDADSQLLPGRFTLMAVIFSVCSLVGYQLLGRLTKERFPQENETEGKYSLRKVAKAALKNRPMVGVMVATVGCMMALATNQLSSYLYKEYYQNTFAMTVGSLANLPVLIVCFPTVPRLAARRGKRRVVLAVIAFSLAVNLFKLIFPVGNVWIYTALYCIANAGQTVFQMLIWAMVADCLDYGEWTQHFRSDGGMYGLYTFARKLGSTIATAGAAASLSIIGYVAGSGVQQSAQAVTGLYTLVNAIPVVVCVLELVGLGWIFRLDQKTCDRMYSELAQRRSERGID